ncbi:hypothetical protein EJB05_07515, partial [Eragrostis curvula]
MAAGTSMPPSRLGTDCDPDHLPLAGRRRRPVGPSVLRAEGSPDLDRRKDRADAGDTDGGGQTPQIWPGLPRGVEFNPSDSDLVWHLAAEIGNYLAHRHPFISEFIVPVNDDGGFSCTHPQDIPGVRRDGRASYFFHKRFDVLCNNNNGKNISWQKVGTPKSIILDETLQGCKEEFALYAYNVSDNSREQTDWRLHQYHISDSVKGDGELVVSKIFHQSQNNLCELVEKLPAEPELPCEDIFNHAETDDLDHMSLKERHIILLVDKSSFPATTSAEISAEAPKRNNVGAMYREDIGRMLQEISSAPPIVESMDDGNDRRLLGEHISDAQMSSTECFVGNILNERPGSTSNSEMPTSEPTCASEDNQLVVRKNGTVLVDIKLEPALEGHELDSSGSPQGIPLHTSKSFGLEGGISIAGCVSKNSENEMLHQNRDFVENASDICKSTKASSQDNHCERSVPSLGIKCELTEGDLLGLCEDSSINTVEPIVETSHKHIHDHGGSFAFRSHQRKKRKTASSSEKAFEKDAPNNVEGLAYSSRRRRRRKTATSDVCRDSIEKALDEDAPGLLQILMDKGITAEEIKLYGAGEDDEMLPDSTENNFEDLENVITKLFPQRTSLLKLSVARHEKGEKAIYCLSCLLSLIEQSRYLQFRDCPVEWGWCRDLQSFIFVFRSHNRIVLERPEYGYATYFFEVVQSLPIEWQVRRLVIAMKLSGCGRTALIENKQLLVGEDLTEGEARVLEEYGWIRNCGLGTMLNYRDRVVHDRWTERSVTDWRTKIGKLLMAGYSEGQTITTHLPKKLGDLLEDTGDIEIDVKLEEPF